MKNKTHNYFEKEYSDFDASYKGGSKIKDVVRILSFFINRKAIQGRLEALLELIGDNINNVKVLEVGCGPGIYSIRLAKKGAEVTSIDYSHGMINTAKKNARDENVNINFIEDDFLQHDFNSHYEYVFATGVIEYIKKNQQETFILKMTELSTNYVIVSFPKMYTLHALVRWLWLRFFKGVNITLFTNRGIEKLARSCMLVEIERIDIGILNVIKFKKIIG